MITFITTDTMKPLQWRRCRRRACDSVIPRMNLCSGDGVVEEHVTQSFLG